MNDELFNLEFRLLLMRHGRRKLLEAFASATDESIDKIEEEIRRLETKKKARARRPAKTPDELVRAVSSRVPAVAPQIATLSRQFESKLFLPQLKDVKRFLDRARIKHGRLKSRSAAFGKVLQALGEMNDRDLARLIEGNTKSGESAFSLLANEIMGRKDAVEQPESQGSERR